MSCGRSSSVSGAQFLTWSDDTAHRRAHRTARRLRDFLPRAAMLPGQLSSLGEGNAMNICFQFI